MTDAAVHRARQREGSRRGVWSMHKDKGWGEDEDEVPLTPLVVAVVPSSLPTTQVFGEVDEEAEDEDDEAAGRHPVSTPPSPPNKARNSNTPPCRRNRPISRL